MVPEDEQLFKASIGTSPSNFENLVAIIVVIAGLYI